MKNILLWTVIFLPCLNFAAPVPAEIERDPLTVTPVSLNYRMPRGGETLDEGWVFRDTLIDANPANPELFNAYPVAMAFSHNGRGYLATLHTVFSTLDYGRTWTNLDQNPPPGGSNFFVLRSPYFISALQARPILRDSAAYDTFYVVTQHAGYDSSFVRLFRYLVGSWFMTDFPAYRDNLWFSHFAIPDSHTAVLLSGSSGRIVRTDTLNRSASWRELDYNFFGGYLAGRSDQKDSTIIAVGSHRWVSHDQGRTWDVFNSADGLGDYSVDFLNDSIGVVGGGRLTPVSTGWIRRTTNGGATWSPRLFNAPFPIRIVSCLSDSLIWIAGGDYENGLGGIWKTTDAGTTWNHELETAAEIRVLEQNRVSPAYVDLVAAGVFPDLRGGVWTQRIFLPDTSGRGAVLYFDPDTLNFDTTTIFEHDTLTTTIHNIGDFQVQIIGFTGGGAPFTAQEHLGEFLNPGDSVVLHVAFSPFTAGDFAANCRETNNAGQLVEVYCTGTATLAADEQHGPLPGELSLRVSPNPGNHEFRLEFDLEKSTHVRLTIFDLQGRAVTVLNDEMLSAGKQTKFWNAAEFASGIYFARLDTPTQHLTTKILLLK